MKWMRIAAGEYQTPESNRSSFWLLRRLGRSEWAVMSQRRSPPWPEQWGVRRTLAEAKAMAEALASVHG
jgi:hypothetical protein